MVIGVYLVLWVSKQMHVVLRGSGVAYQELEYWHHIVEATTLLRTHHQYVLVLETQVGTYGVLVGGGIGWQYGEGSLAIVELLLETCDDTVFIVFWRIEEDNVGVGELTEKMVIYLGVEIALWGIYLIYVRIGKYFVYIAAERNDNTYACSVGKGCCLSDVFIMYRTKDDAHIAHLRITKYVGNGLVLISGVVYMEVY
jgi:hypothetical protein